MTKQRRFARVVSKAADKASWFNWLISESRSAQETLAFLESAYLNLTDTEQLRWSRRITAGDEEQAVATVHELVTVELLRRLKLNPCYEPKINGKTPDISFMIAGQEYIADVYLAHSPKKTYRMIGNRAWESWNQGDRARELEDALSKKARKYDKLGLPTIFFVFIGDHYGLQIKDIEEALLGHFYDRQSFTKNDVENSNQDNPAGIAGLYLRKILHLSSPERLAAVIACDWFDSLVPRSPGKYIYCLVIHYWGATQMLPVRAFKRFPQIVWSRKGPKVWKRQITANVPVIAKLPANADIQFSIKKN